MATSTNEMERQRIAQLKADIESMEDALEKRNSDNMGTEEEIT